MALSAKFQADFSSFYSAVEKAEVSLRSFETGSSKVENQLTRMSNSLSGTKVIQDATLMTEAVARVGGASTLTEKEMAKVNATVSEAIQKYAALGQEAPQNMKDLEEATRSTQSATERFQESWAAFTAAAVVAWASLKKGITEIQGWLVASGAQEDAIFKLTAAMRAQGTYTPELAKQYADMASAFQQTTRYGDELTNEMQALLIQIGNVMPDKMEEALQASMDLSAGLGIDLRAATMLVGKAFAGETGSLSRYGIILDETKKKADPMAATLEAINSKFGGQAAAAAQTYTGKMIILKNAYGDLKEEAGAVVANALLPLMEVFQGLSPVTQKFIGVTVILSSALIPLGTGIGGLAVAAKILIPVIVGPAGIAAAFTGFTGVLTKLLPYFGVAGIIAAGIYSWFKVFQNLDVFVWAAVESWKALTETFKNAATTITGAARAMYEGVREWLVVKFESIVQWVNQKIQNIIDTFQRMYNAVVGNSSVPDMVSGIEAEMKKLDKVMVSPVVHATQKVTQEFEQAGRQSVSSGRNLSVGPGVVGASAAASGITFAPVLNISAGMGSNPSEIARLVKDALVDAARDMGIRVPARAF